MVALQRDYPGLASLRDATLPQLAAPRAELPDNTCQCCRYVVENLRVELACQHLLGGGFGGCTINLVRTAQVAEFVAHANAAYEPRTGIRLETRETTIVDGVGEVVEW